MPETYSPDDWIVHRHHGVGRVHGAQVMHVGGQENTYYKIQVHNSTLWLPADKLNDKWLRPLASADELQQAFAVLQSPPRPMHENLKKRQSQIDNVESYHSPAVIAELLRDLWALKKEKKALSQFEERALRHLTDCFLAEWCACLNVKPEEANKQFKEMLENGRNQIHLSQVVHEQEDTKADSSRESNQ